MCLSSFLHDSLSYAVHLRYYHYLYHCPCILIPVGSGWRASLICPRLLSRGFSILGHLTLVLLPSSIIFDWPYPHLPQTLFVSRSIPIPPIPKFPSNRLAHSFIVSRLPPSNLYKPLVISPHYTNQHVTHDSPPFLYNINPPLYILFNLVTIQT